MLNLSYTITGVEAVQADLNKLRLDAIQAEVGRILDDIAKDAATYPPELPGQRYKRTGRLGAGWTDAQTHYTQSGATTFDAVRENSVSYAPDVMGDGTQKAIFAGRWRTTDQIMEAWEGEVIDRIEAAVERLIQ